MSAAPGRSPQAVAEGLGLLDRTLVEQYGFPDPSGAMFVSHVAHGGLLYLSGTVATDRGAPVLTGVVGETIGIDEARAAARLACIESLQVIAYALGTLDRVERVVQLIGYVDSAPGFVEQPRVINAATELLVEVFGARGLGARAAIGCKGLALQSSVELVLTVAYTGDDVRPALATPDAPRP